MSSFPSQRVGVFIDAQNVYHSAKHLYGSRVNFANLLKTLVGERKLIRAIAYVVRSETRETSDAQRGEGLFFEALKKSGIELHLKDLAIYPGGVKKADWDVGLAVDAIRMANSLDVVVLVTGDGDFIPLVEYLKWGMGKQVEVAAFSRSSSAKLKEIADTFTAVESIPRILTKIRKKM